jgi:hypothetical protein
MFIEKNSSLADSALAKRNYITTSCCALCEALFHKQHNRKKIEENFKSS